MNEAQQLVVMVMFQVVLFGLISWFFPRPCKHCRRWVIPGNRYVWHDPFGYGYTHFDLHNGCAKQYFDDLRERRELPAAAPDKQEVKELKPIPEFGRFLLDESWLIILLLAGVSTLILTKSFLWGGVIGLLAAAGTRATTMLVFRFVFKVDPQLVKPHQRF